MGKKLGKVFKKIMPIVQKLMPIASMFVPGLNILSAGGLLAKAGSFLKMGQGLLGAAKSFAPKLFSAFDGKLNFMKPLVDKAFGAADQFLANAQNKVTQATQQAQQAAPVAAPVLNAVAA